MRSTAAGRPLSRSISPTSCEPAVFEVGEYESRDLGICGYWLESHRHLEAQNQAALRRAFVARGPGAPFDGLQVGWGARASNIKTMGCARSLVGAVARGALVRDVIAAPSGGGGEGSLLDRPSKIPSPRHPQGAGPRLY
jgi:hypothetical protein